MIRPPQLATFTAAFSTAVHADCHSLARAAELQERRISKQRNAALPHGKKDGTMETYARQWSKYVDFAERRGLAHMIPGKNCPWDLLLLWRFMQFRARTCKPSTIVSELSALAHFGAHYGFLLSTSKHDHDSLTYRRVCNLRSQLSLNYRAGRGAGTVAIGPEQCCPLGFAAVELILSALRIYDFRAFASLSRFDRHQVVASLLQHSTAMRFGHFAARMYTISAFAWSHLDSCYILTTDWHRYSGVHRYCLRFPLHAKAPLLYTVRKTDNTVVCSLSTAKVLMWHFSILRAAGDTTVIAPSADKVPPVRAHRQRWLRAILFAALPDHERTARKLITSVTPHSWRPGLAGNLLRAGWLMDAVMRACRWWSERVARMYAERPCLTDARHSAEFRYVTRVHDSFVPVMNDTDESE